MSNTLVQGVFAALIVDFVSCIDLLSIFSSGQAFCIGDPHCYYIPSPDRWPEGLNAHEETTFRLMIIGHERKGEGTTLWLSDGGTGWKTMKRQQGGSRGLCFWGVENNELYPFAFRLVFHSPPRKLDLLTALCFADDVGFCSQARSDDLGSLQRCGTYHSDRPVGRITDNLGEKSSVTKYHALSDHYLI
ncbi:hypothetical protein QBC35DRAFT_203715 [Podospora australis]|uniref:Uncharacterized protein n=1 Tax=Podospora australis TaxID=1536484 RepID=A0AAN6X3Y2_9PEZI|nr:hypothetical protein QBC35DRAFT_203715 [Podospora australis]